MLKRRAVAYLNVDTAVSGEDVQISATPTLSQLIRSSSKRIKDPATAGTLYDRWLNSTKDYGAPSLPYVGQLGSGSDFVGFVDYIGIASMNLAFRGRYGVYHSNYDSFHWMSKFGDPMFQYHAASAKLWGLVALQLADASILPFNYTEYAQELLYYTKQLQAQTTIGIRFGALERAIRTLKRAASVVEDEATRLKISIGRVKELCTSPLINTWCLRAQESNFEWMQRLNKRLYLAERMLLDPQGIPGRTWFKHVVYAPGLWAGYGAATFPSLAEAIHDANSNGNWTNVVSLDIKLAGHISAMANFISDQ
jgi:N-acetylated-alpha-linked acidic dipeptidase